MLTAITVDPLLNVCLSFLIIPRSEFEVVVLIIQVGFLEVFRGSISATAELVDIVVGDIRRVK